MNSLWKNVNALTVMVLVLANTLTQKMEASINVSIVKEQAQDPLKISRTFDCFDHGAEGDLEGLISLIGGKATTLRAMAEKTADLICHKTGRNIACQTANKKLLHYRQFYKKNIQPRNDTDRHRKKT